MLPHKLKFMVSLLDVSALLHLYHQRTFIFPKNFYITNQPQTTNQTYMSPNNFYQKIFTEKFVKKPKNNIFCTEFMVIQDNCGPTLLRDSSGGFHQAPLLENFFSSLPIGHWRRVGFVGGKNFLVDWGTKPHGEPLD